MHYLVLGGGYFLFFRVFFFAFYPPFIWREWEEVGTGRWEVDFVDFFLAHFQQVGVF